MLSLTFKYCTLNVLPSPAGCEPVTFGRGTTPPQLVRNFDSALLATTFGLFACYLLWFTALYAFIMQVGDFNLISWNVRGLNAAARCMVVHETIKATSCHIVCIQETKLSHIDAHLASFVGGYRLNSFTFKPEQGTRGGILILWDQWRT